MPMTVEQVTHWTRPYRGIACVVAEGKSGWVFTVCGSWQTGDAITTKPPKVCRKCRAGLKNVSPTEAAT